MPSWKKVIVSGSNAVLNTVTASFLGNLTGTSSFAVTAATASTADNFYVRGNVGIGTTSPYSRLTTYGALSTGTAQLSIINSEGGHAIIRAGLAGLTNNGISFITADVAGTNQNIRMVISAAGLVGINTTSPAERLHVSGNIYLGTGNQSIRYRTATNWDYYLDATNDDFRIYDSDTTYFLQAVYNGGTTNKYLSLLNTLTVRNNGNVGIGTTNPTLAKLQILGNVSASAYTGSLFGTASFAVTASYAHKAKLADSASYALVTYESTPAQGTQYWPTIATTYGTEYTGLLSDSRLTYFTDNGTLYSPSFSGSFTGSVTNATSASFAPNFANTNLSLNDNRTHNLNSNNLTFTATNDESIVFNHSSGGTFEINGSPTIQTTGQLLHSIGNQTGNIGIGTQTTTARLHVSGTSGVLLRAQNGSTSVLMVSSSGNVGIGTTNPSTKLHLYEAGASDVIFRITPANGSYDPLIQLTGQGNDITTEGFEVWYSNNVGDVHLSTTYPNDDAAIRFHTRTGASKSTINERMTITGGGNVGIGSTNPAAKFLVSYQGGNGSAGDSDYSILAKATGQQTIGAISTNDGYSNLNLGSTVGGSLRMWHISKRISTDASDLGGGDGITMYYYSGTFVQRFGFTTAGNFVASGSITAKTLANTNQANLVMYNSGTGLLTYLATSSFSVVSSSYAVSSSFSTFAATANYANSAGSAGTATNADNAFVATTTDDQNYSLVLALPTHDEYEELKADSANSSYNPSTGTLTAVRLVETSALKYKDNIESLGSTLDQVLKLRGVSFTKKNTGEQQIGFIADEIEKEFPQIVTKDNQGEIHGLSYQRMTAVLLESVKDLNSKIEAQNLFIKDLLDRIEKLENK